MNIKEYENYCADFFNNEKFLPENLKVTCDNLSLKEFDEYKSNIVKSYYSEKNDIVIDMVKEIRSNSTTSIDPMELLSNQELIRPYRNIIHLTITNKFFDIDCIKEKTLEYKLFEEQQNNEKSLKVTVGDKDYIAIDKCDVLYVGWECDPTAWIVEDSGIKKLVVTDHGTPYFETAKFLEEKIEEYETAIKNSKRLLNLLSTLLQNKGLL